MIGRAIQECTANNKAVLLITESGATPPEGVTVVRALPQWTEITREGNTMTVPLSELSALSFWQGFADKSFDAVLCDIVATKVGNPAVFAAQVRRIGRSGMIEAPTAISEFVHSGPGSSWLVEYDAPSGTIVFSAISHDARAAISFPSSIFGESVLDYRFHRQLLRWSDDFAFSVSTEEDTIMLGNTLYRIDNWSRQHDRDVYDCTPAAATESVPKLALQRAGVKIFERYVRYAEGIKTTLEGIKGATVSMARPRAEQRRLDFNAINATTTGILSRIGQKSEALARFSEKDTRTKASKKGARTKADGDAMSPVFILGSPRSGTSSVAYEINKRFGYGGDPEGHVFTLYRKLMGAIDEHFGRYAINMDLSVTTDPNTLSRVGSDWFRLHMAGTLVACAQQHLPRHWFDKTPGAEMIRMAPVLQQIFPDARFIYTLRNGIGNVASRLRKFPAVRFEEHCQEWADCIHSWMDVRTRLTPGSFIEIKTEEITSQPREVLDRMWRLLADGPSRAKPNLDDTFVEIERTTVAETQPDWSEEQIDVFVSICGPAMEAAGYKTAFGEVLRPYEVILPPPHGQAGIRIVSATESLIFPQMDGRVIWTFLHPGGADETRSRIIHHNVTLQSVDAFRAMVKLDKAAANAVTFFLEIHDPMDGNTSLVNRTQICQPGDTLVWNEDLPTLKGAFDIHVGTYVEPGMTNLQAWSQILRPRFFRKAAGHGEPGA